MAFQSKRLMHKHRCSRLFHQERAHQIFRAMVALPRIILRLPFGKGRTFRRERILLAQRLLTLSLD